MQKKRGRPKKATTQAAPPSAALALAATPSSTEPSALTGTWVPATIASGSASGSCSSRASKQRCNPSTSAGSARQIRTAFKSLQADLKRSSTAEFDVSMLSASPKRRRGNATAPAPVTNVSYSLSSSDDQSTPSTQLQKDHVTASSSSSTRKRRAVGDAAKTSTAKRTRSGKH